MLIPLAALPLLAATLDAAAPASARPVAEPHAEVRRTAEAPPPPSIEGSPRLPEPALRRSWCAVGGDAANAGGPALLGRGAAIHTERALREGRVRRSRTRGPPRRDS